LKGALEEATNNQVASETRADDLQRENERLAKELEESKQCSGGAISEDYAALLKKIKELEAMNAKLQKDAQEPSNNNAFQRQLSDMSEKLSASNLEVTHAKQLSQKEISNLRSMLRARDDAIQSLQQRLERSTEEMTTLEAEVDTLRQQHKLREEQGQGELGNLWRLNDEMAKIIEKQSKKVEDLNEQLKQNDQKSKDVIRDMQEKLEGKELEVVEQSEKLLQLKKDMELANQKASLSIQLREENDKLRDQLAVAQEASTSAADAESTHHGRISALECDLAKMSEKVDELHESLTEALEEVDSLQADVKLKEVRIADLEKDLEDANGRVERAQIASDDNSGNFSRLRTEIENLTRDRVRLESDHAREITQMKTDLVEVNKQLTEETKKAQSMTLELDQLQKTKVELLHELEEANNELNMVDDAIDEELEECKQKVRQYQDVNSKLQAENDDLRQQLSSAGSDELREAQQALIALDEEKTEALRDSEERIKKLSMTLSDYEEQVVAGEAKLNRAIREREFIISDLQKEVEAKIEYASQLKRELEALQLTVERNKSSHSKSKRSFGMAIDPDCDDDSDVEVSKLKLRVSALNSEKSMVESEFRAKIEDRDKTISSLVVTSSKQESTIAGLKKEVARLQVQLESEASSESLLTSQRTTRDAQKKEVESLKGKLRDMSAELSRANKKLSMVSQELECAKDQLSTTQSTQDVADLAGRLAVSDQAQRMIKKDNEEKLRERDAAISNLLQTVQTNEKTIKSLKSELENCKRNLDETLEENKRLQHESEIFGEPNH
jgi:chromosome segregation ATPase